MKHTVMLSDNRDFRRIYSRGSSVVKPQLVLYHMKHRTSGRGAVAPGQIRLGLTVSKKLGKAVQRNRARRLLKESYRLLEQRISPGRDIVLVARARILDCRCAAVMVALRHALEQAKLLLPTEK